MRENSLLARQKRRFQADDRQRARWPIAPNIIDQDFTATAPNQKWGVDISYIWTREGWLYLAVVIDLFSRRIVGLAVSDRLHRSLALAALRKAVIMRRPPEGLIHHSGCGSQYCSVDYRAELRRHGISMSSKGNCYDNAMVETFFKIIKSELVWRQSSTPATKPRRPLLAISTASTTPSGAILRSTTSVCRSSNEQRHTEQMPLHFTGASPTLLASKEAEFAGSACLRIHWRSVAASVGAIEG
jgi:transposase InsO family protein